MSNLKRMVLVEDNKHIGKKGTEFDASDVQVEYFKNKGIAVLKDENSEPAKVDEPAEANQIIEKPAKKKGK